ncbi:ester hydrolase C11orf54 homolog [Penaeus chinensis]|uniref:ester hydrolase C11orf54 homolog n=1 Tax=Penaeus chinensis TaxID=139456 RepID=UPI001FB5FC84|nr:ester hydrolase C11orf54 homolog [Penaeus chinensis]
MSSFPVAHKPLHTPPLQEVAEVLQTALKAKFANAEVTVVDCPDLTKPPYGLEAAGLCGSPRLADVGGVPYLMPMVQKDKLYDVKDLAVAVGLPSAFVVGAGAGPHPYVGVNSEMMANIKTGDSTTNGSRVAKINAAGSYELQKLPQPETRCALMLNMYASEGRPGKVLRVSAKKRTGDTNLVTCMREALKTHYGDKPVGLGGTFRLVEGKAKCHVMPEFSPVPLTCDAEVNEWLRFFDMPAPMVFLSTFISSDPDLDLRVEHSHGYGSDCGGHYHYDTTPETVEYEGYYNIAEVIYRIDRPKETHSVGRN